MEIPGLKFVITAALMVTIGFVLNFVWEMLQIPLYAGSLGFWQHVPICLVATLGDVALLFIVYGIVASIRRNYMWIYGSFNKNILPVIFLGILIAYIVEIVALNAHIWQYSSTMPILPYFPIGLTPLLQMAILPLLTFYLTKILFLRYHARTLNTL